MTIRPRRAKVIRFPGCGPSDAPVPRPAEPLPATEEPVTEERSLVAIYRCERAEAVVVKSLLESEGIPTLLRSRIAHSVHPFTVGDQGAVTILVPAREAFRSRRLLARIVRRSSSS
jgi:Putative prokaryotic signal transducing protein